MPIISFRKLYVTYPVNARVVIAGTLKRVYQGIFLMGCGPAPNKRPRAEGTESS